MGCNWSAVAVGEEIKHERHPRGITTAQTNRHHALTVLNAAVEKDLARSQAYSSQKALFLGTGESGKSTVFKQMRLCYGNSFDNFERLQYLKLIWADTMRAIRVLVDMCDEELRSVVGNPRLKVLIDDWMVSGAPRPVHEAKQLIQSLDLSRRTFLSTKTDATARKFLQSYTASAMLQYGKDAATGLGGKTLFLNDVGPRKAAPVLSQAMAGYAVTGELEETSMDPIAPPPHGIEPTYENIAAAVALLWERCPSEIKHMVTANQLGLDTNAAYFLDNVRVLASPAYLATDTDILHARIKTTGITTATFDVKGNDLVVMDVGGQRVERAKWIYSFDDVTCVLFVASVSEYDQGLDEENEVNRLEEALEVFDQTVNSQWFRAKSVQLFLNKVDILETKCRVSSFRSHFPDYQGNDKNPQEIIDYIARQFKLRFKPGNRSIYIHQTCATDTTTMKFVVNAVSDMILFENLKWAGMI